MLICFSPQWRHKSTDKLISSIITQVKKSHSDISCNCIKQTQSDGAGLRRVRPGLHPAPFIIKYFIAGDRKNVNKRYYSWQTHSFQYIHCLCAEPRGINNLFIEDGFKEVIFIFRLKRSMSREHLIQQHPEGPPIHRRPIQHLFQDLWKHVRVEKWVWDFRESQKQI